MNNIKNSKEVEGIFKKDELNQCLKNLKHLNTTLDHFNKKMISFYREFAGDDIVNKIFFNKNF